MPALDGQMVPIPLVEIIPQLPKTVFTDYLREPSQENEVSTDEIPDPFQEKSATVEVPAAEPLATQPFEGELGIEEAALTDDSFSIFSERTPAPPAEQVTPTVVEKATETSMPEPEVVSQFVEPAAEPVAELTSSIEPIAEPTTEPVAESVEETVAEQVTYAPIAEPVVEPVAKSVEQTVVEHIISEPIVEPVAERLLNRLKGRLMSRSPLRSPLPIPEPVVEPVAEVVRRPNRNPSRYLQQCRKSNNQLLRRSRRPSSLSQRHPNWWPNLFHPRAVTEEPAVDEKSCS